MPNLSPAVLTHDTYWAIEVGAGNLLLQQLRTMDAASHLAEFLAGQEARAKAKDLSVDAGPGIDKPWDMSDNTAILRLSGAMTKSVTSLSSGTSTVAFRRQLRAAAADPDVKAILIIVDSPGGSVSGTSDLADDVAAASKKKLVVAYAEDQMCSAAFWPSTQASGGIYANPTAMVGSIGTVMVAYDSSRMYENAGVEALIFSSGVLKGAGAEGSMITPEQRAAFQKVVLDLNDHFLGAVARGRNMARAKVEQLADGGVLIGKAAQKAGLIDGISSLDDVLKSMKDRSAKGGKAGASYFTNDFALDGPLPVGASLEQSLDAVHDAAQEVTARLAKVQTMRAEQGRRLSATRISQVRALCSSLGDLLHTCEFFPLEDEPSAEAEAPVSTSIDPASLAALESALTASEIDLHGFQQANL